MHGDWLQDFIDNELTVEQKLKKRKKLRNDFGAYLKNNFGGKTFVMALWQTGISWARTSRRTTYDGALERAMGQWAQRIIRALKLHQEDADTRKHEDEAVTKKVSMG